MSKLTPITAKVQKGAKGGMIKQPLLNMGAPVEMKYSNKPMPEEKAIKKDSMAKKKKC